MPLRRTLYHGTGRAVPRLRRRKLFTKQNNRIVSYGVPGWILLPHIHRESSVMKYE